MLAVISQPDRTPQLRKLDVPTVVVHGLADKMVHVSGGRATAEAIPGAELVLIPGMGHDLPPELDDVIGDAIERNIRRAERRVQV
jgi:pimeloyl-ACP methyl ester carboxylesterase